MTDKNPSVMVVDDEPAVCDLLCEELNERGCQCSAVLDADAALKKLATRDFNVVLLDIKLPGMSGMEVLRTIHAVHPDTVVVMITGVTDVETVVQAMKLGAWDYIVKPFDLEKVYTSIFAASKAKQDAHDKMDLKTLRRLGERRTESESSVVESIGCMDAIARGVDTRLDQLFGYSALVNKETVRVARQLGVAQKQIQRWLAIRSEHVATRNARIERSLKRLQDSPLAQCIMGTAVPYVYMPESDKSQN